MFQSFLQKTMYPKNKNGNEIKKKTVAYFETKIRKIYRNGQQYTDID